MNIQEILAVFLYAHGKSELATQAIHSSERNDWLRLGDETIRSAPEQERTRVAHKVKIQLDLQINGGPALAEDFEIRKGTNPISGNPLYRAYRPNGEYMCLAAHEPEKVYARLVGMYVVRNISYLEGE